MIVELASTLEKVTLEQLRTLRAVAETESFSGAARSLGKVQSAVSQAMDRLERELGLRLFDRSARSVRLTQAGRSVATAAMRVAREAESLAELANSLAVGVETKLAIVVDSIVPVPALVSFAREFEQTNPRVALSLYTETLSAVTHLVRTKQAAFGIAGPAADATGLERARVGEAKSRHGTGCDGERQRRANVAILSRFGSGSGHFVTFSLLRVWTVVVSESETENNSAKLGFGH